MMSLEILSGFINIFLTVMIFGLTLYNVNLIKENFVQPGMRWLILCCIMFCIWAVLITSMSYISDRYTLYMVTNIFIVVPFLSATCWFIFCYEFTFRRKIPRFMFLCFPIAILIYILGLFNPYNLVYSIDIYSNEPFIPSRPNTIRFFFNIVIGYGLVLTGVGIVFSEFINTKNTLRNKHSKVILYSTFLILFLSLPALLPINTYNFEPILIAILFVIFGVGYSIKNNNFGNVISFASEEIIEKSENIILICDKNNEIINFNKKSEEFFQSDILYNNVTEYIDIDKEYIELYLNNNKYVFNLIEHKIGTHSNSGKAYILNDVTKIKQQEKDLEVYQKVINRVLRHNVKNDMNVITGYSEEILQNETGETKTQAQIINNTSTSLSNTVNKLRQIESVLNNRNKISVNIIDEIKSIESMDKYNNVEINITRNTDNTIFDMNPCISYAIEEIIDNGVSHNKSDKKIIDITIDEQDNNVSIKFEDNGVGIKQHEIDVIESNNETNHKHGSGSGLWLINWIINRSDGTVKFHRTDTGTCVEINLLKL